MHEDARLVFVALVGLTVLIAVLMRLQSTIFPALTLLVPLLLTDSMLPPRRVPAFVAALLARAPRRDRIQFLIRDEPAGRRPVVGSASRSSW